MTMVAAGKQKNSQKLTKIFWSAHEGLTVERGRIEEIQQEIKMLK